MTDTTIDPEILRVLEALRIQERHVLSLLHGHRREADRIVAAAGLAVGHFAGDDHRLAYSAWLTACQHDLSVVRTARLLSQALKEGGFWDPLVPAESISQWWSDLTVASLFRPLTTEEEWDDLLRNGPGEGLKRAIARNVVALIETAETLAGGAP